MYRHLRRGSVKLSALRDQTLRRQARFNSQNTDNKGIIQFAGAIGGFALLTYAVPSLFDSEQKKKPSRKEPRGHSKEELNALTKDEIHPFSVMDKDDVKDIQGQSSTAPNVTEESLPDVATTEEIVEVAEKATESPSETIEEEVDAVAEIVEEVVAEESVQLEAETVAEVVVNEEPIVDEPAQEVSVVEPLVVPAEDTPSDVQEEAEPVADLTEPAITDEPVINEPAEEIIEQVDQEVLSTEQSESVESPADEKVSEPVESKQSEEEAETPTTPETAHDVAVEPTPVVDTVVPEETENATEQQVVESVTPPADNVVQIECETKDETKATDQLEPETVAASVPEISPAEESEPVESKQSEEEAVAAEEAPTPPEMVQDVAVELAPVEEVVTANVSEETQNIGESIVETVESEPCEQTGDVAPSVEVGVDEEISAVDEVPVDAPLTVGGPEVVEQPVEETMPEHAEQIEQLTEEAEAAQEISVVDVTAVPEELSSSTEDIVVEEQAVDTVVPEETESVTEEQVVESATPQTDDVVQIEIETSDELPEATVAASVAEISLAQEAEIVEETITLKDDIQIEPTVVPVVEAQAIPELVVAQEPVLETAQEISIQDSKEILTEEVVSVDPTSVDVAPSVELAAAEEILAVNEVVEAVAEDTSVVSIDPYTDEVLPVDAPPTVAEPEPIAVEEVIEEVVPVVEHVIPEVPPEIPYLIVGGGTAAYSAVRAIRKYDPAAKILIVSEEDQMPYNRTPLSKELWFADKEHAKQASYKDWKDNDRSVYHEKIDFYCTGKEIQTREGFGGTALLLGAKVDKVDPDAKTATLANGTEIKYEKCLLAIGGKPKNLPVFEQESLADDITLFRNLSDFWKLDEIAQKGGSVVVVGSGFLGTELAYALGDRTKTADNLKVTQICRESGVLGAVLPIYLSEFASEALEKEGVNVVRNAEIASVSKDEKININLNDGKTIEADHVVVAVGLDIDHSLAQKSGLEVDSQRGGLIVNSELESRRDIYVAGDAANFYDQRLGRRRVEHYDHAIVTGRLAGENMVGKRKAYTHQSMFWSDIGPDIGFEAIGLVDSKLKSVGVFAEPDKPLDAEGGSFDSAKYDKGVVFYVRHDVIVGVVTWNLFGKMGIARRLLALQSKENDFEEIARLFNVHKG